MALVFGGLSFPLAAPVDGDLEPVAQPFTSHYLPYLQDVLNHYVGAAFAAAMRGKVAGQSATLACQQTGIVDPGFQLAKTTCRLPYLALYVESGTVSEGTMRWDNVETKYALAYILPPLPIETIQEVAVPLLAAVQKLLVLAFKLGGDDSHEAGRRVGDASGIVSVRMGAWQIVQQEVGDGMRTEQAFPMLLAEVFVVEQEGYDDASGETLEGIDASLDVSSDDGVDPDTVQIEYAPD